MKEFEMNELIEEYATARTKHYTDNGDYWKGVMHTYQKMLNIAFGSEWTKQGTIGYFVFYEGMSYAEAGVFRKNNPGCKSYAQLLETRD